jgi:peroxiredoxin
MNAWSNSQSIFNVKVIPDGNGMFTDKLGMTVSKENLGFGYRSWRYAAIINNGKIEAWFEEPGKEHDCETDPYGESSPENLLKYLKG